jgi:hypothetical protein
VAHCLPVELFHPSKRIPLFGLKARASVRLGFAQLGAGCIRLKAALPILSATLPPNNNSGVFIVLRNLNGLSGHGANERPLRTGIPVYPAQGDTRARQLRPHV